MSEDSDVMERENADPKIESQPVHDADREAIEAEARRQGWRPKEEFTGNGTWVDAPEFVERGAQFRNILKRENRDLREEVAELRRRAQETTDVFKEFREHQKQTEERAYARARRELEQQRDTAAAASDMDGYRRTQQQLQDLERDRQPQQDPQPRAEPTIREPDKPQVDPRIEQWGRDNPWMLTDKRANQYAQAVHVDLLQNRPDLSLDENLAEVRREVAKAFPQHFGNARRDAPSPVSRSANGNGRQPKKEKGYDDLPADAKAACDRFVKQGLYENREAYCKVYQWDNA